MTSSPSSSMTSSNAEMREDLGQVKHDAETLIMDRVAVHGRNDDLDLLAVQSRSSVLDLRLKTSNVADRPDMLPASPLQNRKSSFYISDILMLSSASVGGRHGGGGLHPETQETLSPSSSSSPSSSFCQKENSCQIVRPWELTPKRRSTYVLCDDVIPRRRRKPNANDDEDAIIVVVDGGAKKLRGNDAASKEADLASPLSALFRMASANFRVLDEQSRLNTGWFP